MRIIDIPAPIPKGGAALLSSLCKRLYESEYGNLLAANFSNAAQSCRVYKELIGKTCPF